MTFMYQVYALFGISDNYTSLRWKEQTSSSCSNVIFIIIIFIIIIIIIIIRNETTGKLRSPWKIHAQLMKRVRMRKESIVDLLVLIKQEGEVEKLCKNDTTLHEYLRKKVQKSSTFNRSMFFLCPTSSIWKQQGFGKWTTTQTTALLGNY